MASRMERYSSTESKLVGRSDRNKSLYKQIENLGSYTNIAGVATIEDKNSIDINKVRELLKNVETEKTKIIEKKEIPKVDKEEEEIRNYDINDLLSKIKDNESSSQKKYRSLSSEQYKVLKELNEKNDKSKRFKDDSEQLLTDLINTVSNMKVVSEDDDVGLLDDLKSDTMVGDASSIKKIIDEEKELTNEFENMNLDKSFYTSSFGFTQKDFNELKDMNNKIKKDNKKIITLLIVLIILIIICVVFFVLN